jgi:hypothetical protein
MIQDPLPWTTSTAQHSTGGTTLPARLSVLVTLCPLSQSCLPPQASPLQASPGPYLRPISLCRPDRLSNHPRDISEARRDPNPYLAVMRGCRTVAARWRCSPLQHLSTYLAEAASSSRAGLDIIPPSTPNPSLRPPQSGFPIFMCL